MVYGTLHALLPLALQQQLLLALVLASAVQGAALFLAEYIACMGLHIVVAVDIARHIPGISHSTYCCRSRPKRRQISSRIDECDAPGSSSDSSSPSSSDSLCVSCARCFCSLRWCSSARNFSRAVIRRAGAAGGTDDGAVPDPGAVAGAGAGAGRAGSVAGACRFALKRTPISLAIRFSRFSSRVSATVPPPDRGTCARRIAACARARSSAGARFCSRPDAFSIAAFWAAC